MIRRSQRCSIGSNRFDILFILSKNDPEIEAVLTGSVHVELFSSAGAAKALGLSSAGVLAVHSGLPAVCYHPQTLLGCRGQPPRLIHPVISDVGMEASFFLLL